MRLKLDLDEDATARLVKQAVVERRPVPWQAEVLLRKALGLPFSNPRDAGQNHKVDEALTESVAGADQ